MTPEIQQRIEQIRRGEIPPGYKRTVLKWAPESWSVKPLKELVIFLDKQRIPIKESERLPGIYPYYGASGIIDYVDKFIFDGEYILLGEDGANIVDRSSPLAFRVSGKCWINNHAHVLEPLQGYDIIYLTNYLESLSYSKYNTGTAQPKLNQEVCGNIPIAFPELEEQRKIADILSTQDKVIELKERLIAEKQRQKKYLMQQFLTGKKRLSGFQSKWHSVIIGEIGEFYGGLSGKSKSDFGIGNARYITFKNILENTVVDTSQLAYVRLGENERQNTVKQFDLFFNLSSETAEEVGMCAVLLENLSDTYLNSFCTGFRVHDNSVFPYWLSYYFNSGVGRKMMNFLAQGITRVNLNKAAFAKATILIPTIEEQKAIAKILSSADEEIELLRRELEEEKRKKKALSQFLLTGIVRV